MKKSLCAHCKNGKEAKYDGFLCDCTGYIEYKNVEEGCDHFEDDICKAVNESYGMTSKYSMSDIIATMAINGATRDELERAIKYSAAVIDAERARKELDAVDAFFDKYDALIKSAPRNSLLGMINELNDAFLYIEGVIGDRDEQLLPSNEDVLNQSKKHITHVALILAQMWLDENPDIELTCVDPATGEETIVNGKEEKEDD